jgi:hypothetical protein
MEEVVGGAGDVNLALSGETAFDISSDSDCSAEGSLGVAGRDSSVEGMSESWDSWDKDACESILPR